MFKKIVKHHILVLAILISMSLVGCDELAEYDSSVSSAEQSFNPDVSGIYIGEDGSLFVLFDDGKGTFFTKNYKEPKDILSWEYTENKQILIHYRRGVDVKADAPNLSVKEYLFTSDNPNGWVDEAFTKHSDEPVSLTGEESMNLLKDQLPVYYPDKVQTALPEYESLKDITYDIVSYGGIEFSMPSDHIKDGDSYYNSAHNSLFVFLIQDKCIDEKVLDYNIEKFVKGTLEEFNCYYIGQRKVASLNATEGLYTGERAGIPSHEKVCIINNPNSDKAVFVAYWCADGVEEHYASYYDALLNSAKLEETEKTQSLESADSNADSRPVAEETPSPEKPKEPDTSWKEDLPFKYNDKYTKSQNLYLYMIDHELTKSELTALCSKMGLICSFEKIYSDEMGEYRDDYLHVSISGGGTIKLDLRAYNGSWRNEYLSYYPPGSSSLNVRTTLDKSTFIINDYDHPASIALRQKFFNNLEDAVDFINKNIGK